MSHLGERLSAFVDGELDHSHRDRVLSHLAACESCRFEAEMLRQLKRRLCGMDAPVPSMDFMGRLSALTGPGAWSEESSGGGPGSGKPPRDFVTGPGRGNSDGERPRFGSAPPLGSSRPIGGEWPRRAARGNDQEGDGDPALFRRMRQGRLAIGTRYGLAGACVAALALGTAFMADGGERPEPEATATVEKSVPERTSYLVPVVQRIDPAPGASPVAEETTP